MKIWLGLPLAAILFLTSCTNIFLGLSNRETDDALYEDATKAMDDSLWDVAIGKFQTMSPTYLTNNRKVRQSYAGALAGKCGLDFITYLTSISGSSPGATVSFFNWFMQGFKQKTVSPASCVLAENQIKLISVNPNLRTPSENLFMLFLAMVKIGTTLRNRADIDSTNSLGEGTPDATFNACTTSGGTNVLTDAEVTQIITGIGLIIENLAYLPSGTSLGTSFSNLQAVCGATCNITDSSVVSASDINTFRDLISLSNTHTLLPGVGIGSCVDLTIVGCCP